MVSIVFIIAAIAFFLGSLPTWSYSRNWGFLPSGIAGLFLTVLFLLLLIGVI